MFPDLRTFIKRLREQKDLVEVSTEVDPRLEIAEIHRRVVAENGPAVLFTRVKGSSFPVVTNLFGSNARTELAFGDRGFRFIEEAAKLPSELMAPSLGKLWNQRGFFSTLLHLGTKERSYRANHFVEQRPAKLGAIPLLTTWHQDGGAFVTLPLVYTEHPETGVHNLGMYRLQRYDDSTTGLHTQIGKGGGYHLVAASALKQNLPVNVFIGGPPALLLSAIAPLPENAPELLLASLLLGDKIQLMKNPHGTLPLLSEAEFNFVGYCDPNERRPEGPFGDHYGYYSLTHDFPVFHCQSVFHRKDAIFPATVVGKPRQEDFFIGNSLQKLLSPLFPLVMPSVKKLWSYGETGYHSLAAAVVKERYKREALVSAFRILGEGQLSLTKFLLLLDKDLELENFTGVLEYILERADFRTDLYIFSNTSMDTLDYAGPKLNEGSKGVFLGMGEPRRELPVSFNGTLPPEISAVRVFCRGCLVVTGKEFSLRPQLAEEVTQMESFSHWPLIILSDNAEFTTSSEANFLWSVFTRFEPAGDIKAKGCNISRFHPELTPPIVIDSRMKPHYPEELFCDPETQALVTKRWKEYFPSGF